MTVLARPVVAAGDDEEALTVDDILDLYETPPPSPLLPRIVRLRAGNATSECFRVRVRAISKKTGARDGATSSRAYLHFLRHRPQSHARTRHL